MFGSLQAIVYFTIAIGAFVAEVWALIDALRHSNEAYYYSGKRNKSFWTAVLGGATAVGFLGLPAPFGGSFTNALGLLGIAGIVAAGIYLVDVRPQLRQYRGGQPRRKTSRGGW